MFDAETYTKTRAYQIDKHSYSFWNGLYHIVHLTVSLCGSAGSRVDRALRGMSLAVYLRVKAIVLCMCTSSAEGVGTCACGECIVCGVYLCVRFLSLCACVLPITLECFPTCRTMRSWKCFCEGVIELPSISVPLHTSPSYPSTPLSLPTPS